jgi:ACT domain
MSRLRSASRRETEGRPCDDRRELPISTMIRRVVLTAIGDGRPGLVEELSALALERGASIEESRMMNMHGQFTIAVLLNLDRSKPVHS